jgi:hypothetical protein
MGTKDRGRHPKPFTKAASSGHNPRCLLLVSRQRFFACLAEEVIRVGSFASVAQLVNDINFYLA